MTAALPPEHRETTPRGVLVSVVASFLFAALFFLPPLLEPFEANEIFAWRVIATVPVLAALVGVFGWWRDVRDIALRLARRPLLVLVIVLDGLLLSVQLWLFGWAPQTGHGLELALGYLLMPLAMVVVGVVLHRERLAPLRIAAVAAAAVGVTAAIVVAGGLSWATVAVALGYPVYFAIRRRAGLDSIGAFCFELLVLVPVAVVLALQPSSLDVLAAHPQLGWGILLLGVIGGVALVLYLVASRLLSFGVFGLLSYLEPVLLVHVAVLLLGESLTLTDVFVYGPIVLALVLLGLETVRRPSR
ncbi:EamA family transporter RarD [Plantibacter sp. ME-Dv--P-095]|uniref:EamA family transporter RarD n=1 Tax=Plantibacter sp. ME-Dv--P-095 TaxID=3040299 RepID=UPI00254A0D13|nr:EamA family transporter RarD [Plantibacter sp. ME-Dv--P-095]